MSANHDDAKSQPRSRAVSERTLMHADATGTSETLTFASCCGEPNHITLVGFSRGRLVSNHASMWTRHAVRRQTSASASPAGVLM